MMDNKMPLFLMHKHFFNEIEVNFHRHICIDLINDGYIL